MSVFWIPDFPVLCYFFVLELVDFHLSLVMYKVIIILYSWFINILIYTCFMNSLSIFQIQSICRELPFNRIQISKYPYFHIPPHKHTLMRIGVVFCFFVLRNTVTPFNYITWSIILLYWKYNSNSSGCVYELRLYWHFLTHPAIFHNQPRPFSYTPSQTHIFTNKYTHSHPRTVRILCWFEPNTSQLMLTRIGIRKTCVVALHTYPHTHSIVSVSLRIPEITRGNNCQV